MAKLFSGLFPTMLREVGISTKENIFANAEFLFQVPGCFFFFLGVEGTKNVWSKTFGTPKSDLGLATHFLAGGVGGSEERGRAR